MDIDWRTVGAEIRKAQTRFEIEGYSPSDAWHLAAAEVAARYGMTKDAIGSGYGAWASSHQKKSSPAQSQKDADPTCDTQTKSDVIRAWHDNNDEIPSDNEIAYFFGVSGALPGAIRAEYKEKGFVYEKAGAGRWKIIERPVQPEPEVERTYTEAEVQEMLKDAKRQALMDALGKLS